MGLLRFLKSLLNSATGKPAEDGSEFRPRLPNQPGEHVVQVSVPQHEDLWAQAIADVLGDEVEVEIIPDGQTSGYKVHPSPKAELASAEAPHIPSAEEITFQRAGITFDGDFISIERPRFLGQFSQSANGRFICCWDDSDYLLLNGTRIAFRGKMQKPASGKVSNTGTSILNQDHEDGGATFHAFSAVGERIFQHRFDSALDSNGISDDGSFAVCQTFYGEDDEDDNKVCLFDLGKRELLAKWTPVFGGSSISSNWKSRQLRIEPETRIVWVSYEAGPVHRYDFNGTFLDAAKWETERLTFASGYELLEIAEGRLNNLRDVGSAAISGVITLLDRALARGVSEFTQAKIHRHLGELHLRRGDKSLAIEHLESALRLYPKIGVKKLLARLRKPDTQGE